MRQMFQNPVSTSPILTHYQAPLPVNPQKACIITNLYYETSCSRESALKQRCTVVRCRFFRPKLACYPPSGHTNLWRKNCTALSLQWGEIASVAWKVLQSCINITKAWHAHCAPAPHPQIPRGIVSSPPPFDERLLSVLCRVLKTWSECKVFSCSVLKEMEAALHQKAALVYARCDVKKKSAHFEVEHHLFGCTSHRQ